MSDVKPSITIIGYEDNINRTPALLLALKGQVELIETGLGENRLLVRHDLSAFVLFVDDKPVGVQTYKVDTVEKTIFTVLVYILPEYRGNHYYRPLWNALVDKAKELNIPLIEGRTSVRNGPVLRAVEPFGREIVYSTMQYKVEIK